ncbi:MAG: peptidylprolyl isomerase [Cyanobacteria bacterium CRU_2_1]|nr:peptidylprolyl isomerase [Cyanobacteria bacterium RU_5_0]NJR62660.1 peptidylprolyl isomerase [Cyanobacteria bacterium CRU_2_1]
MIRAIMETDKGTIHLELFDENAPVTVKNFVDLSKSNFYDGLTFHRVESGFVIQGGDPNGNGTGGSDMPIPLEIWAEGAKEPTVGRPLDRGQTPMIKHDAAGVISMARTSDPNSATSQFFITLDAAPFLDGQYAAFGKTENVDVVQAIRRGDKILSVKIEE